MKYTQVVKLRVYSNGSGFLRFDPNGVEGQGWYVKEDDGWQRIASWYVPRRILDAEHTANAEEIKRTKSKDQVFLLCTVHSTSVLQMKIDQVISISSSTRINEPYCPKCDTRLRMEFEEVRAKWKCTNCNSMFALYHTSIKWKQNILMSK